MKIRHHFFQANRLLIALSLIALLFVSVGLQVNASNNQVSNAQASNIHDGIKQKNSAMTAGYSALKLFLEDEQYLTTVRRVNTVITFEGISDNSARLIDAICDASEVDIVKLEKLADELPTISFKEFSDDSIVKATFNSLRLTTAKDLLFETDEFEKNILLSQLNVLRLISHLAIQLSEKETSPKRKEWLDQVAVRYEKYYQQVNARILVAADKNS